MSCKCSRGYGLVVPPARDRAERRRAVRPVALGLAAVALIVTWPGTARAGYPPGDAWYQNPLGFTPVKLHTSNALLLAGAAAGAALLLTRSEEAPSNRFTFYEDTGVAYGYKGPYTTVYLQELGALYHVRRWLAVGGELAFYQFRDAVNDTPGLAVRPMVRWYAVSGRRLRLFFESGAGLILTTDQFPKPSAYDDRTGLRLNGATRYGIGGEIALSSEVFLLLGARHLHVSNGNVRGVERNPSHDSNGFFVGASYAPVRSDH